MIFYNLQKPVIVRYRLMNISIQGTSGRNHQHGVNQSTGHSAQMCTGCPRGASLNQYHRYLPYRSKTLPAPTCWFTPVSKWVIYNPHCSWTKPTYPTWNEAVVTTGRVVEANPHSGYVPSGNQTWQRKIPYKWRF
jgi:hypothetical protein